jgi:hypothetical protein
MARADAAVNADDDSAPTNASAIVLAAAGATPARARAEDAAVAAEAAAEAAAANCAAADASYGANMAAARAFETTRTLAELVALAPITKAKAVAASDRAAIAARVAYEAFGKATEVKIEEEHRQKLLADTIAAREILAEAAELEVRR